MELHTSIYKEKNKIKSELLEGMTSLLNALKPNNVYFFAISRTWFVLLSFFVTNCCWVLLNRATKNKCNKWKIIIVEQNVSKMRIQSRN